MFKYDGFYNKLFEDKEFVNILCSFHTSNWGLMDKEARFSVIKKFVDRYCFLLGIPSLKIKKYKNKKTSGFYSDNKLQVAVNEKSVENGNPYDILDTLFHETRHNFQERAISRNLTELEYVDENKRKESASTETMISDWQKSMAVKM